jgi:hypothetical protein
MEIANSLPDHGDAGEPRSVDALLGVAAEAKQHGDIEDAETNGGEPNEFTSPGKSNAMTKLFATFSGKTVEQLETDALANDGGRDEGRTLHEPEQEVLAARAIPSDFALECGLYSTDSPSHIEELGYSERQAKCRAALVIRLWNINGREAGTQLRPRKRQDKPYLFKKNARGVLYVVPSMQEHIDDPRVKFIITESPIKAIALAARLRGKGKFVVAGIAGVYGFRGINSKGGKTILEDFKSELIAWTGKQDGSEFAREVYLIPDSDHSENPNVRKALSRLAGFIRSKRAIVQIVQLPEGPGETKKDRKRGIDDYLTEHPQIGFDELKALVVAEDTEGVSYEFIFRMKLYPFFIWSMEDGGKYIDMRTAADPKKGIAGATLISGSTLEQEVANTDEYLYVDSSGERKSATVRYTHDKNRHETRGRRFMPGRPMEYDGFLNTWPGFSVEPRQPSHTGQLWWWRSLLYRVTYDGPMPELLPGETIEQATYRIAEEIRAGKGMPGWYILDEDSNDSPPIITLDEKYEYHGHKEVMCELEEWFAYIVKHPENFYHNTIPVLFSRRGGIGKSELIKSFAMLFKPGSCLTVTTDKVTSQFDGLLANKMLVNIEEAYSDKREVLSKLKALSTARDQLVNHKYGKMEVPDCLPNLIASGNELIRTDGMGGRRILNRTTRHWYTQAASCEYSPGEVVTAARAWTAAVTSGV